MSQPLCGPICRRQQGGAATQTAQTKGTSRAPKPRNRFVRAGFRQNCRRTSHRPPDTLMRPRRGARMIRSRPVLPEHHTMCANRGATVCTRGGGARTVMSRCALFVCDYWLSSGGLLGFSVEKDSVLLVNDRAFRPVCGELTWKVLSLMLFLRDIRAEHHYALQNSLSRLEISARFRSRGDQLSNQKATTYPRCRQFFLEMSSIWQRSIHLSY
jgi:hypothetical protein